MFKIQNEKRQEEVLECLHPLEFKSVQEISKELHENRQEYPIKKYLFVSDEQILDTLLELSVVQLVEFQLEEQIISWLEPNGEEQRFEYCQLVFKSTGKKFKKKSREKIQYGVLLPQGA